MNPKLATTPGFKLPADEDSAEAYSNGSADERHSIELIKLKRQTEIKLEAWGIKRKIEELDGIDFIDKNTAKIEYTEIGDLCSILKDFLSDYPSQSETPELKSLIQRLQRSKQERLPIWYIFK